MKRFVLGLLLSLGCSSPDEEFKAGCEANVVRQCFCEDGSGSTQACAADGSAWGACLCEGGGAGTSGSGGGGGTSQCTFHADCRDDLACVQGVCADAVILPPDAPCGENPLEVCPDGYRCRQFAGVTSWMLD